VYPAVQVLSKTSYKCVGKVQCELGTLHMHVVHPFHDGERAEDPMVASRFRAKQAALIAPCEQEPTAREGFRKNASSTKTVVILEGGEEIKGNPLCK
jgi:hypothetical protein